ncbi:hypothetical protein IP93_01511 [Lysobacter ruishenii]|uniref:Transmembrane repetitive protein n=2 Tax=Aerolutibacter ruishenii TaxID=686800 RepID=A0A562LVE8_9GAMM|nr:hypothetical protein IP93_01511 [Lysobacter ruishenii]
MSQRVGAVTGARPEDVVGVLVERPLPLPPERAVLLSRWQSFSTLWRQQWHPAPREERHVRWAAAVFSVLVNLFFAGALVWLMYLQFLGMEPPPQGEQVVQVEFMGKGTPGEVGGGAPEAPADPAPDSPATPSREIAREAQPPVDTEVDAGSFPEVPAQVVDANSPAPELTGAPLEVREREVAAPPEPAASQAQAVAVSEPVPDSTDVFVLPPPRTVAPRPESAPRALQANASQVQEREVAAPVRAHVPLVETDTPAARPLVARAPQMVARDVVAPVQAPSPRVVELRSPAVRELAARTPSVREREVRAPAPVPAQSSTGPSTTPAATSRQATAPARLTASTSGRAATSATAPASSSSAPTPGAAPAVRAPGMASPGTGPKAQPAPGSWATPSRADDWGDSAHNTPGGQRGVAPGVFNADGSVRLADGPGSASPGMPPGAITQEIANLDRAGTWLKRKPTDFEPTSFDKYWVPNETLLAEWVRKSIKEVLIPIPGTNKRIRCAVVLLALGGACGITDPNLNEQPASARPPPDVPFKPHLQDDNGSLRPGQPPGG